MELLKNTANTHTAYCLLHTAYQTQNGLNVIYRNTDYPSSTVQQIEDPGLQGAEDCCPATIE